MQKILPTDKGKILLPRRIAAKNNLLGAASGKWQASARPYGNPYVSSQSPHLRGFLFYPAVIPPPLRENSSIRSPRTPHKYSLTFGFLYRATLPFSLAKRASSRRGCQWQSRYQNTERCALPACFSTSCLRKDMQTEATCRHEREAM